MIYITGDTHIPHDIHKLSSKQFSDQKTLAKEDYVIICGDFGGVWEDGNRSDKYWLDWPDDKPFTTLFVDGNHENHDLLDAMPVEQWNGVHVHFVRDSVIHLMRGQVFTLNRLKFFTMGGRPPTTSTCGLRAGAGGSGRSPLRKIWMRPVST